ncbi:hypothetical protein TSUD_139120 [Trifolium subterraneum]|uniref:RNase H type-1 domain-containing protein n=1 Tax=Trifolium subterraneum TaxID=3900 RepID=A0A2Z6PJW6_TRISU|nr:hypothetical protein TSUD_139120 [Trifolium subterraneum]
MQIVWLPQSICDNIGQTTRNFIWRDSNNKGIHLVGWEKITRPKRCGGLGIRPARDANISLLGKLVWDMVQTSRKLWVDLLSSKYVDGPKLLSCNLSSGSSTWSSITRATKSSKMFSLGVQVRDLLPFGSPLGPLLAALNHSSPMSIFMIYISRVDRSCLGSPVRSGFGSIIRNTFGHYLAGFSGFISGSSDILLAELYTIYKGLLLAKDMSIDELVYYSDSLHCVNLIKGPQVKYHVHAVLIQDIKDLLSQISVSLHHTLREGNPCADFFAKLGASSDVDFLTHTSPPEGVRDLLRNDAMRTLFIRE